MSGCIVIQSADEKRIRVGKHLSQSLKLTLSDTIQKPYCLVITDNTVELHAPEFGKPISVDFVSGKNAHRRKFGGGRGQPFAKAIGLKGGQNPTVIDATAGYGRDAFVLANLGCKITLIERQTLLWALLHDAIETAKQDPEISEIADRMSLIHGTSTDYLAQLPETEWPDVIYMDPMYPSREKSALVKKEMQLLHQLVGPDIDSEDLLAIAQKRAKKRVVVKRPNSAPFISEQKPSVSIEGKTTRYDIYLTQQNLKQITT